jgi:hypothetical protein
MSNTNPTGAAGPGNPSPAQGAGGLPLNIGKNYLSPQRDGIDFVWYETQLSLAAGLTSQSQINIDAGTDFYWIATSASATEAGAAQTANTRVIPQWYVIITDTGSQRQLMNQQVPLYNIAGTGSEPYRLIYPRLFKANSIIQFSWTSYEAANTYSTDLTLHGFRMPASTPFTL